jgi:peptidoglycan hydrolase-like protein with peptidoglycan-binding domain
MVECPCKRRMRPIERETAVQPQPRSAAQAVVHNRRYHRSLGWQAYRHAIERLLGFGSAIPSEQAFATAVARWQTANRLPANGVIGPETLTRMKAALRAIHSFPGDSTRAAESSQEIPPDPAVLRQLRREFQFEAGQEIDKFVTEQAFGFPEGHKSLTQLAAGGLPISSADLDALKDGNARVDELSKAFDAAEQRRHTLRRFKCQPVADALTEARNQLVTLHRHALAAPTRQLQFEILGECLHLIQDSYSNAHTERRWGGAGGIHPIVFIRFFGFQGSCAFPLEHRVVPPPDPRDMLRAGGRLKPWAQGSVTASREYLRMALRHLAAPRAPGIAPELGAFMNRHLRLDPGHTPINLCYPTCPAASAACAC